MTNKIKQNKAGKWIDAKTGRFVSRAIYEPFAIKKAEANAKRSTSLKEYWNDVKKFVSMGYSTQDARKCVHKSPKYLAKRGKTGKQFSAFWDDLKKLGLNNNKQAVKDYKRKLEDEGVELIS